MPILFGKEVSDHTYELNRHLLTQPKEPKTQARKDIDAEMRQLFARQFEATWALLDGPALEPEHYFDTERRWHSDYLHRPTMTLIELEGGVHSGGRHVGVKASWKTVSSITERPCWGMWLSALPRAWRPLTIYSRLLTGYEVLINAEISSQLAPG